MIVVLGNPAWRETDPAGPAGRACDIAVQVARQGADVQLVGRAGDDRVGDALLLALAAAGVGHVALLRDPTTPTLIVAPRAHETADSIVGSHEPDHDGDLADVLLPRLEQADVSLALEYLQTFAVLVVTDDVPVDVLPAAIEAASFADAHLVVLVAPGAPEPELPAGATAIVPPVDDEGAFAALVAIYATGLDAGVPAPQAFARAVNPGAARTVPDGTGY